MTHEEHDRRAVALDYETYYDTKAGYSLSAMSPQLYCADERFDAYLVAICGWEIMADVPFALDWEKGKTVTKFGIEGSMFRKLPDGRQLYVGRPENFKDWENLKGRILLAHNAAFDSVVTDELAKRGLIPAWMGETESLEKQGIDPGWTAPEWKCTADLAAYLMVPRNLKGAMKELFGKEISKAVRAGMDGRHDYDLNPEERCALVEYGGSDAVECHDIWLQFSSEWGPMIMDGALAVERAISDQKRDATKRGILVDRKLVEESIKELKRYHAEVVCDVPWYPEKPVGSLPALRAAVIELGLMPPPSFKKDDPRFLEWIERPVARYDDAVRRGYEILDDFYEEVHHPEVRENSGMAGSPSTGNERVLRRAYTERVHLAHIAPTGELAFLKARQKAVAINMHLARLEGILASLDKDGLSHPAFLYFGAHTGRDSGKSSTGGSNTNMLNMPRKPILQGDEHVFGGKGVDIRGMYVARPGHKFVVYDYSQIEARFSLWLVDDTHMMEAMRREGNLYQANAVMMGWCKPGEKIKKTNPDVYRLAKCCLTGETLVLVRSKKLFGKGLTRPYYKRIISVVATDQIWDGHEWVPQLGAERMKYVTKEELVEVGGVCLTKDHRVYVDDSTSRRADEVLGDEEAAAVAWSQSQGPVQGWTHVRLLASAFARLGARALCLCAREAVCLLAGALSLRRVRRGNATAVGQRAEGPDDQVREVRASGEPGEDRAERVGEDAR